MHGFKLCNTAKIWHNLIPKKWIQRKITEAQQQSILTKPKDQLSPTNPTQRAASWQMAKF